MPLIACPECNRQVSDRAPQCPSCGTPIGAGGPSAVKVSVAQQTSKWWKLLQLAGACVAIAGGIVMATQFAGGGHHPDQDRVVLGIYLLSGGLAGFMFARLVAWWFHG